MKQWGKCFTVAVAAALLLTPVSSALCQESGPAPRGPCNIKMPTTYGYESLSPPPPWLSHDPHYAQRIAEALKQNAEALKHNAEARKHNIEAEAQIEAQLDALPKECDPPPPPALDPLGAHADYPCFGPPWPGVPCPENPADVPAVGPCSGGHCRVFSVRWRSSSEADYGGLRTRDALKVMERRSEYLAATFATGFVFVPILTARFQEDELTPSQLCHKTEGLLNWGEPGPIGPAGPTYLRPPRPGDPGYAEWAAAEEQTRAMHKAGEQLHAELAAQGVDCIVIAAEERRETAAEYRKEAVEVRKKAAEDRKEAVEDRCEALFELRHTKAYAQLNSTAKAEGIDCDAIAADQRRTQTPAELCWQSVELNNKLASVSALPNSPGEGGNEEREQFLAGIRDLIAKLQSQFTVRGIDCDAVAAKAEREKAAEGRKKAAEDQKETVEDRCGALFELRHTRAYPQLESMAKADGIDCDAIAADQQRTQTPAELCQQFDGLTVKLRSSAAHPPSGSPQYWAWAGGNEEREQLRAGIRDLIAKLQSQFTARGIDCDAVAAKAEREEREEAEAEEKKDESLRRDLCRQGRLPAALCSGERPLPPCPQSPGVPCQVPVPRQPVQPL